MPPEAPQHDPQYDAAQASLKLAFRVLAQVALLTIVVLLVALFGGQALDRLLATKRVFTISLLLLSFPVSLYIIYRVALSTVSKIKPVARKSPRAEEELDRDDNASA